MIKAITPLIKAKLDNSGEFSIFMQVSQRLLNTFRSVYTK